MPGSRTSQHCWKWRPSMRRLLVEGEPIDEFACIPLARVIECKADRQVLLDDRFIPTVARSAASPVLAAFLRELDGLLHQRGEALGGRVTASGRSATAEVGDYLMLQAINRYEPVAAHLATSGSVHPEDLFCFGASLAGELATYTLAGETSEPARAVSARKPPCHVRTAVRRSAQRAECRARAERRVDSARGQALRHPGRRGGRQVAVRLGRVRAGGARGPADRGVPACRSCRRSRSDR